MSLSTHSENPWASETVSEDAQMQKTWLELLEEAKARRYEAPPYEFQPDVETDVWRYGLVHISLFRVVILITVYNIVVLLFASFSMLISLSFSFHFSFQPRR